MSGAEKVDSICVISKITALLMQTIIPSEHNLQCNEACCLCIDSVLDPEQIQIGHKH